MKMLLEKIWLANLYTNPKADYIDFEEIRNLIPQWFDGAINGVLVSVVILQQLYY